MFQWLLPRRRAAVDGFPLDQAGSALPWHSPEAEVRWQLGQAGALGLELGGRPSVRMKLPDRTLRASLEFMEGAALEGTWFGATPGAVLRNSRGEERVMEPLLRAGQIAFAERNPRDNWKWVQRWLGKPYERTKDGVWSWEWPRSTARYWDCPPEDEQGACLRFQARTGTRVLEIVNQSSRRLYDEVAIQLHFGDGSWALGPRPPVDGVVVRLHWEVPRDRSLRLTATAGDSVTTSDVPPHARRAVLANDGRGGVRVVV